MTKLFHSLLRMTLLTASLSMIGCASLGSGDGEGRSLAPFTTDGCSLFPDGNFENKTLWQDCCVQHDISYWQGGTREQRLKADEELRVCIIEVTGDRALAQTVFDGVRAGGSPIYPSWYRWGYGWSYGRMYRPQTEEEKVQIERRLHEYKVALLEVISVQPSE